MKCYTCGRSWHVPSEGGYLKVNNQTVCSQKCGDEVPTVLQQHRLQQDFLSTVNWQQLAKDLRIVILLANMGRELGREIGNTPMVCSNIVGDMLARVTRFESNLNRHDAGRKAYHGD